MANWPPLRDYRNSRAVVMGTWNYKFLEPIPAARNSLLRMTGTLCGWLCGWPKERVLILEDEPSPGDLPDRLITAFDDISGVALFYFVGHGQIAYDDQLCLGLVQSRPEVNRRAATSLRFADVRQALQDSGAATKIVVLDCCFAGLATTGVMAGSVSDVLDLTAGTGAYTMAATSAYASAWYETDPRLSRPQTYFTKYLVDLVERGIPGQPSGLRLEALYRQVRDDLAKDQRPVPRRRALNDARDFIFAHNAAPSQTHRNHEQDMATMSRQLTEADAKIRALTAEAAERARELARLQGLTPGTGTTEVKAASTRQASSPIPGSVAVSMPKLGWKAEGTVDGWFKQVGEYVQAADVLAQISDGYYQTEVRAPISGVLGEVIIPAHVTVAVGTELGIIVVDSAAEEADEHQQQVRQHLQLWRVFQQKRRVTSQSSGSTLRYTGGTSFVEMPSVGDPFPEGTVSRWLKKEGEYVHEDEPLVEVHSDMAVDFEVPSPASGVLQEIIVEEDWSARVGAVIGVIKRAIKDEAKPLPDVTGTRLLFTLKAPRWVTDVARPVIFRWLKGPGHNVKIHEPLLEITTDYGDIAVESPVTGILRDILAAEDDSVEVGTELALIDIDVPSRLNQ
jgi:biotin carboxyl carrier protein